VIDAMKRGEQLPPGDIRITSDLICTAQASRDHGIALLGAPGFRTRIIADYNGDPVRGGIVRLDTVGSGNYSWGSVIRDIVLMPAPGRTGLNGVSLTAAWMVELKRVQVMGAKNGFITPIRTDINPISDFYQCWAVDAEQCWIEGCTNNGVDFGAGQSPGGYRIAYSQIIENAGIGIRSTTGQCVIDTNVISYNGVGGLSFETAEGPSMVASMTRNEIQDNVSYGLSLVRSRDMRLISNRFLSQTYSNSTITGSPQNGGPFMRQSVQVNLGSGATGEVWNLHAQGNLHRSVNGSIPTKQTVIAYDASGGSLDAKHPCQFLHNDFGPTPFDGVTQNSRGFKKFAGSMPGAIIVDP
jgi:hypothetical protein